ncbi:5-hydroxytryptamine receptor 2A-like [Stylophora pistillata]|uniref:5-hydroxytryptamine receptor 2A-like n=1 Tax=Stylophora pistillata TaxID=50429 RepID=UPI000C052C5B|nr:5-hydroxytryptamine receptor 2A-like [Stylophora pistillata]
MADTNTDSANSSGNNVENSNKDVYTVFGVIFILIGLLASLGNTVVLYVVKRDPLKCLKKPTNVFNIALTVTHVFVGMIVSPFTGILNIFRGNNPENPLPSAVVNLEAFTQNIVIGTATLFLCAISTERCTAVLRPHFNKRWLTQQRAKFVSISAVASCLVFCSLLFLNISKTFFYMIYLHVFILLPVCGILISCTARLRNFKKQARVSVINSGLPVAQIFASETRKRNSQMVYKLLVTLFSILLPILSALFLFYAVKLVEITCDNCFTKRWFIVLNNMSLVSLFLSSVFNPVVILRRIAEYSRSIRHILGQIR